MNFNAPEQLLTEITQLLWAQQRVAGNRAKLNRLYNGDAPNTPEEAREENLKTNYNSLDGTRIISNAANQLNGAALKGSRYFSVNLDKGPLQKRAQWSATITKYLNKELKHCRAYRCSRESANAQVVLHGPGPLIWRNRKSPCPTTVGIEDILVPSGTLTTFENLDRFAIYRELTWRQLYDAAFGKVVDPGWNKDYVKAILATLYKLGFQPVYQGNRWLFPEKMAEDAKEGMAATMNSSLPKLLAWDFFYLDQDTGKINRRMLLDYPNMSPAYDVKPNDPIMLNKAFIYEKDDYAEDRSEIIHWYIGNCSNVSPYHYYSIRSMGYLLYGTVLNQNKLRCRLQDHMYQQLLTWFRNVSDDNREKVQLIDIMNFGILPEGVSMVTADERHTADYNLILMGLNQGRQIMAESASSFIADMPGDPGRSKTMTATESLIRQNASITLTSAVLSQLIEQSPEEYREISRRFCIKSNPDPMVKRFLENVKREGVPEEALDYEAWDIIPEQAVGGGNKANEMNVTQVLMQEVFPLVGPDAQRALLRRRAVALTDNPDEANALVPEAPQPPSDDVQYAQMAFAVLIEGIPFIVKEGIDYVTYTAKLMELSQIKMQQTAAVVQQQLGISIAAEDVAGLMNVLQHCEQGIMKIAQSESRKELAKNFMKALQEMKANLQRLAEQVMAVEQERAQQQGGIDPKTLAKIEEMRLTGEAQRAEKVAAAQQKQEQKDIAFQNENLRRNAQTQADVERKRLMTVVEAQSKDLLVAAEIARPKPEPASTE